MGACFGSQTLPSNTKLNLWYRKAVEQAIYDFGHDPYNGTISTTCGIKLADHSLFNTDDEAVEWLKDHCQKWGQVQVVKVGMHTSFHYLAGWWAVE